MANGTQGDRDVLSILVVDDNEAFLDIVRKYLGGKGFCVDVAGNGQQGIEKYMKCPDKYDAVLLDIQMPVMSGFEALKHIRDSEGEEAKRTPVLAMSGAISSIDNTEFDALLCKPFKLDILLHTLTAIINA